MSWLKLEGKECFKIDSNTRSFLWTRIVRYYRFEKSVSKSASDLSLICEDFGFCFFWILQSPSRFPRLPSSRISNLVDFRVPRVNHLESELIVSENLYGCYKCNLFRDYPASIQWPVYCFEIQKCCLPMAGIEIWNCFLDFLSIEKSRSSFHNPKEKESVQMSKWEFILFSKFIPENNRISWN